MGHKPASRVEAALYELKLYGFMITPGDEEALLVDPPQELDAFVDAVLAAEGYEYPELATTELRSYVAEVAREWLFDDDQGKGTRSGLPLTHEV
jgi:hypothetical protein